jgi:hypothetical protein
MPDRVLKEYQMILIQMRAMRGMGLVAVTLWLSFAGAAQAALPNENEALPSYFKTGVLDFESRVWAQMQIEKVWYEHRIWPKENPGPKPLFPMAITAEAIESKVRQTLLKASVMKSRWGYEISAGTLQIELNRMAKSSLAPETLREIFAALHDDPRLIAETLARQTISDQMIRQLYFNEKTFHVGRQDASTERSTNSQDYFEWWEKTANENAFIISELENSIDGDFFLPIISGINASLCNAWDDPLKILGSPTARYGFTAVWTGSEMVVWGGNPSSGGNTYYNDGGRYDPTTDTWRSVNVTGAPQGRNGHSAIWTGTKMIIWGGTLDNASPPTLANTGGRYDPVSDSWQPTSTGANVPSVHSGHSAVWTGNIMIVFGGASRSPGNIGAYSPTSDSWQPLSLPPNGYNPNGGQAAVWSGTEMIAWGGGGNGSNLGARYNPSNGNWTIVSLTNAPSPRIYHSTIWTAVLFLTWVMVPGILQQAIAGLHFQ